MITIIFSKDRAMQLEATLLSLKHHCEDFGLMDLTVLYNTSTTLHEHSYKLLQSSLNQTLKINWVRESEFQSDLLRLLRGHEYVLFLVDDNLFVHHFSIASVCEKLSKMQDALGFSLRLG